MKFIEDSHQPDGLRGNLEVCTSTALRDRFLNDELSDTEADNFAEHIQSCADCMRRVIGEEQSIDLAPWINLSRDCDVAFDDITDGDDGFDSSLIDMAVRDAMTQVAVGSESDHGEPPLLPPFKFSRVSAEETALLEGELPNSERDLPEHGSNSDADADVPLQRGEVAKTVGGYRLIRLIGRGGFGEVFEAVSADEFERVVAVKRLHGEFIDPTRENSMLREIEILSAVKHENVVRVLDAGTEGDGRPFLVTEFVEGSPLVEWCDSRQLTVRERVELFLQVCDGVAACHEMGVIHRDLKPANILVDQDGRVKILDFGLARALEPTSDKTQFETQTGVRMMTPAYASPEQIRGEKLLGPATDVYSLGVVLHLLLSGSLPVARKGGGDDQAVFVAAMSSRRPALPSANVSASDRTDFKRESQSSASEREDDSPAVGASRSDTNEASADTTRIVTARRTTPQRLVRELRGDLDRVITKSLDPMPGHARCDGKRYLSVADLAEDLRRHLDGAAVLPEERTVSYRTKVFLRRRWRWVLVALTFVLLLGGGLIGALVLLDQAEDTLAELRNARRQNLDALEKYLDTIVSDDLLAEAQLDGLQKKLLADSAELYREALAEIEDEPDMQLRWARGVTRLAVAHLDTDSAERAEQTVSPAISVLRTLKSEPEPNSDVRLALADALRVRAICRSRLGNHLDAEADVADALVLVDSEHRQTNPRAQAAWNNVVQAEWAVYYRQRKDERAKDCADRLRAAAQSRYEATGTTADRIRLADAVSRVGVILHKGFSRVEALKEYQVGLELLGISPGMTRNPATIEMERFNDDEIRIAAKLLSDRGLSLNGEQRIRDSVESHTAAKMFRQELVARQPLRLEYRRMLAVSSWNLADALYKLPDRAAENAERKQALDVIDGLVKSAPADSRFQAMCGINVARLCLGLWRNGEHDTAIREFEQMLATPIGAPERFEQFATTQQVVCAGLYLQVAHRIRTRSDATPAELELATRYTDSARACLKRVEDRQANVGEPHWEVIAGDTSMFDVVENEPWFAEFFQKQERIQNDR